MDDTLFNRFETALSANQLDSLVVEMKAEGRSQAEIFEEFNQFRNLVDRTGRKADEDKVLEILDRIWGWCAPEQQLFSDYLTDEKIEAYRQQAWKLKKEILPVGWYYATPAERESLGEELQRELPQGHPLFNKPVQIIAHRAGATDDILCRHLDEPNRYTVIHLTWSMKTEIDTRYPTVEVDGRFQDFLAYEQRFWQVNAEPKDDQV